VSSPGEAGPPPRTQALQLHYEVQPWDKSHLLVHLLAQKRPAATLVVCRSTQAVDSLVEFLRRKRIAADALHAGGAEPIEMEPSSILVTTDAAVRGVEVGPIQRLINYDLPDEPEEYLHRLGRLERAQRGGAACSFVTPDQHELLRAIETIAGARIERQIDEAFVPGQPPAAPGVPGAVEVKAQREETVQGGYKGVPVVPPSDDAQRDTGRFPGGLVPVAMPPKRMGGRVPTKRR
jgi:superfamily II DNA/RNA helicase